MQLFTRSFLATLALVAPLTLADDEPGQFERGSLTTIEPDQDRGFQHPYLIYIPESAPTSGPTQLLVEPNNTGKPDDDFEVHRGAAEDLAAKNSVGHLVAHELGVPFIVPIFPRPMENWKTYTHALDTETIRITQGPLARIDLQLIAMIDDARRRLTDHGYEIPEKVLMTGFSASGTFINRFVMLHPDRVGALAAGGFNSVLFLPADTLDGHTLNFPIGTNDYEQITGHAFDLEEVNKVPQLYYMGEHDTNDAVPYDDAYNPDEREAIHDILAEDMHPERWTKTQRECSELGLHAEFRTIKGIGHGTDQRIIKMILKFLRANTVSLKD